jgi:hypothetical protein
MKLTEYQLQINSETDFQKWKSTWVSGDPIPDEVMRYVKSVIFPRMILQANKTLNELTKIKNENTRISRD